MGLDQYAYELGEKIPEGQPNDFGHGPYDYRAEIGCWRKHNRLQGWMEDLYREKGGTGVFNTDAEVDLTLEDLDNLEKAVENEGLPKTGGFFFGADSYEWYDEEFKEGGRLTTYRDKDLRFISDARQALNKGRSVVYTCWW